MVKQFFIVNKSGGMIYKYEKEAQEEINKLMVLTSTIHSLNEISRNVLSTDSYLQTVEIGDSTIYIYRTLTNILFIFVSDFHVQKIFEQVYSHFCDCVLSNPFYQPEMPINLCKFNPSKFFVYKKK